MLPSRVKRTRNRKCVPYLEGKICSNSAGIESVFPASTRDDTLQAPSDESRGKLRHASQLGVLFVNSLWRAASFRITKHISPLVGVDRWCWCNANGVASSHVPAQLRRIARARSLDIFVLDDYIQILLYAATFALHTRTSNR